MFLILVTTDYVPSIYLNPRSYFLFSLVLIVPSFPVSFVFLIDLLLYYISSLGVANLFNMRLLSPLTAFRFMPFSHLRRIILFIVTCFKKKFHG